MSALTYGTANLGKMETEGYDLGIKYRLPEFSFGKIVVDCAFCSRLFEIEA